MERQEHSHSLHRIVTGEGQRQGTATREIVQVFPKPTN